MFRKKTYTPKTKRRFLLFIEIALYLIGIGLLIQVFFVHDTIISAFDLAASAKLIITKNSQKLNTTEYIHWIKNTCDDVCSIQLFNYYIFNITNPYGVINGEIPKLKEIGPFVFNRYELRRNVHFSTDGKIVNYKYEYQFVLNKELMNDYIYGLWNRSTWYQYNIKNINNTDNTTSTPINIEPYPPIYTLNPFMLALLSMCRLHKDIRYHQPQLNRTVVISACIVIGQSNADQIFTNQLNITFQELIQDGIHFDLMNVSKAYINDADVFVSEYTGDGDVNKMRELISLYGINQTSLKPPFWRKEELISGTREPKQWPYKKITSTSVLDAWMMDKFRHVNLIQNGTMEVQGLEVDKFIIDPKEYLSEYNNTANRDYYQSDFNGIMKLKLYDGLLNLTTSNGNDVLQYASKPYFLDAPHYARQLNKAMDIRQPNRSADDTWFAIDTTLGTTFKSQLATQVSLALYPCMNPANGGNPCNNFGENYEPIIVPTFYVEINAGAPPEAIQGYKEILDELDAATQISIYAGPAWAFGAFIIALYLSFRRYCKWKQKKRETLYMVDDNSYMEQEYDDIDQNDNYIEYDAEEDEYNAENDENDDFSLKRQKRKSSDWDDSLFTGFAKRDSIDSDDKPIQDDNTVSTPREWKNNLSSGIGSKSLSSLLTKKKKTNK